MPPPQLVPLQPEGRDAVIEEVLAKFAAVSTHRIDQLECAIQYLAKGELYFHLLTCELMFEIQETGLWTARRRPDGTPYPDVAAYLREGLGMQTYHRSAIYQRLGLGKTMRLIDSSIRESVRDALRELGWSKALAIAPLLRITKGAGAIAGWLEKAKAITVQELRKLVAIETEAKSRRGERAAAGHETCPTCHRPWRGATPAPWRRGR